MACPVNAVEITASAMIAGTNVAARFSPNEPSGSSVRPTSSVIGMNMVSNNCSPLRSNSLSSRPNCAASIFCTVAGRGSGANVPGAKRLVTIARPASRLRTDRVFGLFRDLCAVSASNEWSRSQLPARPIEEDVLEAALLDSHVGGQHIETRAPRGDGGQHLGVDVALDQIFARCGLGGFVTLGQRRHQQREVKHPRREKPRLVLGAAAHQLRWCAGGHRDAVVYDRDPVGQLLVL